MPAVDEIKTMKLYTHLERVYHELQELHLPKGFLLDPERLSDIDSLHYCGNQAVLNAIDAANILVGQRVLDIGSGLGGPARMLAHYTDCHVDAYELQPDLHEMAQTLTECCGLTSKVRHIQGDFLSADVPPNNYDAIVSWLVFLHINNRDKLFEKCAHTLKDQGIMYVEDLITRDNTSFTINEREMLAKDVYVNHPLPTMELLQQELTRAGFEIVEMRDMTKCWTEFVVQRFQAYQTNLARHQRVHGVECANELFKFFQAMKILFQGGHLGGIAYKVKKTQS